MQEEWEARFLHLEEEAVQAVRQESNMVLALSNREVHLRRNVEQAMLRAEPQKCNSRCGGVGNVENIFFFNKQ